MHRRAILLVSIAALPLVFLYYHSNPSATAGPPDPAFVEKLKSAQHYQSTFPAPKQTFDLLKKVGLRKAALNAIGMEDREVTSLSRGDPESAFAMLSHLGGYGEIIWVDEWTNFSIKLPPSSIPNMPNLVVVPRHAAVRATLDAITASGGCLIQAGKNRYLVARVADRQKYQTALRSLGWLDGAPPPWSTETNTRSNR